MTYSVFHADFHDASRLNAAAASRQTWLFLCVITPQTIFYHQTFSSLMCVFLPTGPLTIVEGELVEGIDRAGMRVSDDVGDGDERSNRIRVSNSSVNQFLKGSDNCWLGLSLSAY
jgi:hypothetical protein